MVFSTSRHHLLAYVCAYNCIVVVRQWKHKFISRTVVTCADDCLAVACVRLQYGSVTAPRGTFPINAPARPPTLSCCWMPTPHPGCAPRHACLYGRHWSAPELSMGPFCVTQSNPTHPMGQPCNPWTTLVSAEAKLGSWCAVSTLFQPLEYACWERSVGARWTNTTAWPALVHVVCVSFAQCRRAVSK